MSLPRGIRRRHARSCPAYKSDDMSACGCTPRYQLQAGPRTDRRTATFDTVRDARRWRAEQDLRTAWKRGRRTPTVRQAAEEWLAEVEVGAAVTRHGRPYRARTVAGYRRDLHAHVLPALGDSRLDDVTRGDLLGLIGRLQAQGLAPTTVRNVLLPLRVVYRWAIDHEHVRSNVTLQLPVHGVSESRRERFADAEEAEALIAAVPELDRPLWACAFYAGLRRGELMALRWADVDMRGRTVHVRRAYDPTTKQMAETKSRAGRRTIGVSGQLSAHLAAHRIRSTSDEESLVFARGSLAGSFRGDAAWPFADQGVGERGRRAWSAAGLTPVTLHEARHSYGSMLLAAGVPIKTVSVAMGHDSVAVTEQVYLHLTDRAVHEAADLLDAYVRGRAGAPTGRPPAPAGEVRSLPSPGEATG